MIVKHRKLNSFESQQVKSTKETKIKKKPLIEETEKVVTRKKRKPEPAVLVPTPILPFEETEIV